MTQLDFIQQNKASNDYAKEVDEISNKFLLYNHRAEQASLLDQGRDNRADFEDKLKDDSGDILDDSDTLITAKEIANTGISALDWLAESIGLNVDYRFKTNKDGKRYSMENKDFGSEDTLTDLLYEYYNAKEDPNASDIVYTLRKFDGFNEDGSPKFLYKYGTAKVSAYERYQQQAINNGYEIVSEKRFAGAKDWEAKWNANQDVRKHKVFDEFSKQDKKSNVNFGSGKTELLTKDLLGTAEGISEEYTRELYNKSKKFTEQWHKDRAIGNASLFGALLAGGSKLAIDTGDWILDVLTVGDNTLLNYDQKDIDKLVGYDRREATEAMTEAVGSWKKGDYFGVVTKGFSGAAETVVESLPLMAAMGMGGGSLSIVKATSALSKVNKGIISLEATIPQLARLNKAEELATATKTLTMLKELKYAQIEKLKLSKYAGNVEALENMTTVPTKFRALDALFSNAGFKTVVGQATNNSIDKRIENGAKDVSYLDIMALTASNVLIYGLEKFTFEAIAGVEKIKGAFKSAYQIATSEGKASFLKGIMSQSSKIAVASGTEAGQEYLQTWGEILTENVGTKEHTSIAELLANEEYKDQALGAAILGGLGGGQMHGTVQAIGQTGKVLGIIKKGVDKIRKKDNTNERVFETLEDFTTVPTRQVENDDGTVVEQSDNSQQLSSLQAAKRAFVSHLNTDSEFSIKGVETAEDFTKAVDDYVATFPQEQQKPVKESIAKSVFKMYLNNIDNHSSLDGNEHSTAITAIKTLKALEEGTDFNFKEEFAKRVQQKLNNAEQKARTRGSELFTNPDEQQMSDEAIVDNVEFTEETTEEVTNILYGKLDDLIEEITKEGEGLASLDPSTDKIVKEVLALLTKYNTDKDYDFDNKQADDVSKEVTTVGHIFADGNISLPSIYAYSKDLLVSIIDKDVDGFVNMAKFSKFIKSRITKDVTKLSDRVKTQIHNENLSLLEVATKTLETVKNMETVDDSVKLELNNIITDLTVLTGKFTSPEDVKLLTDMSNTTTVKDLVAIAKTAISPEGLFNKKLMKRFKTLLSLYDDTDFIQKLSTATTKEGVIAVLEDIAVAKDDNGVPLYNDEFVEAFNVIANDAMLRLPNATKEVENEAELETPFDDNTEEVVEDVQIPEDTQTPIDETTDEVVTKEEVKEDTTKQSKPKKPKKPKEPKPAKKPKKESKNLKGNEKLNKLETALNSIDADAKLLEDQAIIDDLTTKAIEYVTDSSDKSIEYVESVLKRLPESVYKDVKKKTKKALKAIKDKGKKENTTKSYIVSDLSHLEQVINSDAGFKSLFEEFGLWNDFAFDKIKGLANSIKRGFELKISKYPPKEAKGIQATQSMFIDKNGAIHLILSNMQSNEVSLEAVLLHGYAELLTSDAIGKSKLTNNARAIALFKHAQSLLTEEQIASRPEMQSVEAFFAHAISSEVDPSLKDFNNWLKKAKYGASTIYNAVRNLFNKFINTKNSPWYFTIHDEILAVIAEVNDIKFEEKETKKEDKPKPEPKPKPEVNEEVVEETKTEPEVKEEVKPKTEEEVKVDSKVTDDTKKDNNEEPKVEEEPKVDDIDTSRNSINDFYAELYNAGLKENLHKLQDPVYKQKLLDKIKARIDVTEYVSPKYIDTVVMQKVPALLRREVRAMFKDRMNKVTKPKQSEYIDIKSIDDLKKFIEDNKEMLSKFYNISDIDTVFKSLEELSNITDVNFSIKLELHRDTPANGAINAPAYASNGERIVFVYGNAGIDFNGNPLDFLTVFLHEFTHTVTQQQIKQSDLATSKEAKELFEYAKSLVKGTQEENNYEFTDIHEFFAVAIESENNPMLSGFNNWLKTTKYKDGKSLYQKVRDLFKRLTTSENSSEYYTLHDGVLRLLDKMNANKLETNEEVKKLEPPKDAKVDEEVKKLEPPKDGNEKTTKAILTDIENYLGSLDANMSEDLLGVIEKFLEC